jgi:hypothetical protein
LLAVTAESGNNSFNSRTCTVADVSITRGANNRYTAPMTIAIAAKMPTTRLRFQTTLANLRHRGPEAVTLGPIMSTSASMINSPDSYNGQIPFAPTAGNHPNISTVPQNSGLIDTYRAEPDPPICGSIK